MFICYLSLHLQQLPCRMNVGSKGDGFLCCWARVSCQSAFGGIEWYAYHSLSGTCTLCLVSVLALVCEKGGGTKWDMQAASLARK